MPKPISSDFITLRGRVAYARVLGEPMENFDKDGKEFKMDFIFDDYQKDNARLKKLGVADRVKQKEDYLDGQPHMTVRQKTEKIKDPDNPENMIWKNRPKVEDIFGAAWSQTKLLGNDTVVDLKLRIADYGKGFKKGIYINGIRVLELVPYVKNAFEEIDKDDPYYIKANAANSAAGNNQSYDNSDDADEDDAAEQVETNADPSDDDDDEAV